MTIRSNTDLGRRAETHLATITGTSNSILFHAGHRKLGMSNRNRDNLLVGEPPKRVLGNHRRQSQQSRMELALVSAVDSQGRTIWIVDAHRDDGKRFIVRSDELLAALLELESAMRLSEPIYIDIAGLGSRLCAIK
jgi:hypothetical protein